MTLALPPDLFDNDGSGFVKCSILRGEEEKYIRIKKINWKTAHPIGILLAQGFRYLPDGSVCWMLLGALKRRKNFRKKKEEHIRVEHICIQTLTRFSIK